MAKTARRHRFHDGKRGQKCHFIKLGGDISRRPGERMKVQSIKSLAENGMRQGGTDCAYAAFRALNCASFTSRHFSLRHFKIDGLACRHQLPYRESR